MLQYGRILGGFDARVVSHWSMAKPESQDLYSSNVYNENASSASNVSASNVSVSTAQYL